MKNIFLLLMLFPFFGLKGQDILKNTVKVQGRAVYIDPSPNYKAVFTVSRANTSYGFDAPNLDELIKNFKQEVETQGIRWEDLKENPNPFGFETMGFDKKGAIFEYRTSSSMNMKKMMSLKTIGLRMQQSFAVFKIDPKEAVVLNKIALSNAIVKANAIVSALGKKLGDIIHVEDRQNPIDTKYETNLYYDRPPAEYVYYLNVEFSVK